MAPVTPTAAILTQPTSTTRPRTEGEDTPSPWTPVLSTAPGTLWAIWEVHSVNENTNEIRSWKSLVLAGKLRGVRMRRNRLERSIHLINSCAKSRGYKSQAGRCPQEAPRLSVLISWLPRCLGRPSPAHRTSLSNSTLRFPRSFHRHFYLKIFSLC